MNSKDSQLRSSSDRSCQADPSIWIRENYVGEPRETFLHGITRSLRSRETRLLLPCERIENGGGITSAEPLAPIRRFHAALWSCFSGERSQLSFRQPTSPSSCNWNVELPRSPPRKIDFPVSRKICQIPQEFQRLSYKKLHGSVTLLEKRRNGKWRC